MSNDLPGPLPARWYCVSRDGIATLCKDREDAEVNASHCDLAWPAGGPHRVVLMGDVAAERDEIRCLRAALKDVLRGGDDMTGSEYSAVIERAERLARGA